MAVQIVLITGCSKGIGKETALYLAKDPQRRFKVYATMRNVDINQDELKTKAGDSYEDTLFIRKLDVTKQETIDTTVKDIVDHEGRVDNSDELDSFYVSVNNAGIISTQWWETAPMESFYDVMEVNYFGCVRMTKAVVPHMKRRRSGRIIQISSVLGFKALPVLPPYIASKFVLEGFSESIAPPLRKFNIWVSLIQPGYTLTPIVSGISKDPPELFKYLATLIPGEDGQIVMRMVGTDPSIVEGTETQFPPDIAKIVLDSIVSPKPDFRYQSSEIIKGMARLRLVDPTGNGIMDTWLKQ
ncbi:retinol dehydrogenase 8-like [Amphiura filiformis]|uniref:retinol dehydrogenase 8-like n=1 Tax=Amphiura filiformis TaxID=82378 RepID=UPI003B216A25